MCVVAGGALHPDIKIRQIIKNAKIGRTLINGYSIFNDLLVLNTVYSTMIKIINIFQYIIHLSVGRDVIILKNIV